MWMEDWDRFNPTFLRQAIALRAVSPRCRPFSFGPRITGELFWLPLTGGEVNSGHQPD
jgi:hypothetical protein